MQMRTKQNLQGKVTSRVGTSHKNQEQVEQSEEVEDRSGYKDQGCKMNLFNIVHKKYTIWTQM